MSEEPTAAAKVSAPAVEPTAPPHASAAASQRTPAPRAAAILGRPRRGPADATPQAADRPRPPIRLRPRSGGAAAQDEDPVKAKDPWANANLPWQGKPRRVDIACWAAITLSGLYYLALLPFRASLVGTHPLVSVLLNGSTEAIVSGGRVRQQGARLAAWCC